MWYIWSSSVCINLSVNRCSTLLSTSSDHISNTPLCCSLAFLSSDNKLVSFVRASSSPGSVASFASFIWLGSFVEPVKIFLTSQLSLHPAHKTRRRRSSAVPPSLPEVWGGTVNYHPAQLYSQSPQSYQPPPLLLPFNISIPSIFSYQ